MLLWISVSRISRWVFIGFWVVTLLRTISLSQGSGESYPLRLEGDGITFRRIFKASINLTTRKTVNNNGSTCPIEGQVFIHQLSDYHLVNQDSAAWI